MENGLVEELIPDKVHSVNNEREPHHNRGSEDCAEANHQKVTTHDVHLEQNLILHIKAEEEVAQDAY